MSKQLTDLEKPGVQHIVYELHGAAQGITGIPQYGMLTFSAWAESKDRKIRLEADGQLGEVFTLDDDAVIQATARKYLDGEEAPMPELPAAKPASSSLADKLRDLAEQLEMHPAALGADLRVIITGNIIDGMTIWGPFDGPDAADWAHDEFPDQDWLQVALLSPDNKE